MTAAKHACRKPTVRLSPDQPQAQIILPNEEIVLDLKYDQDHEQPSPPRREPRRRKAGADAGSLPVPSPAGRTMPRELTPTPDEIAQLIDVALRLDQVGLKSFCYAHRLPVGRLWAADFEETAIAVLRYLENRDMLPVFSSWIRRREPSLSRFLPQPRQPEESSEPGSS